MEVDKIGLKPRIVTLRRNNQPAFGSSKVINKSARALADSAGKKMFDSFPPFLKFLKKMDKFKGETASIIINAIGTGLVAPIFIAYNPLSEADSDTKKYSAMRQPVSAVLAVVTQAGLTIPLDRFYEKLANEGKLGFALDKSLVNSEAYLKRYLLKQGVSKERLASEIKRIQEAQKDKAENVLLKNNTIVVGKERLADDKFNQLLAKTLGSYKSEIDTKLANPKDISDKIRRSQLFWQYGDLLKEKFGEVINFKGDKKALIKKIDEIIVSLGGNKELIELFNELKPLQDNEAIVSRASNTIRRFDEYKDCTSLESVADKVRAHYKKNETDLKNASKFLDDIIADVKAGKVKLTELIELMKKQTAISEKSLARDLIENWNKKVTTRFAGFKQFTGMGVSLAMLPITCSLLNYVYPRFMDIFFPSISSSKKSGAPKVAKNGGVNK